MKSENMKSVSAYVHTRHDIPSLCTQLNAFWLTPIPERLRTYLIDGPFLNQKTYKDIRISYSLKYNYSKNKFLYEK